MVFQYAKVLRIFLVNSIPELVGTFRFPPSDVLNGEVVWLLGNVTKAFFEECKLGIGI